MTREYNCIICMNNDNEPLFRFKCCKQTVHRSCMSAYLCITNEEHVGEVKCIYCRAYTRLLNESEAEVEVNINNKLNTELSKLTFEQVLEYIRLKKEEIKVNVRNNDIVVNSNRNRNNRFKKVKAFFHCICLPVIVPVLIVKCVSFGVFNCFYNTGAEIYTISYETVNREGYSEPKHREDGNGYFTYPLKI